METITTQTLAEGFKFLEGPRWHEDRIWMSDVVGRKVFTLDLLGKVDEVVAVPGMPSGLGFLPDGTPLVVSMADRCLFRLEGGKLVRHAALDSLVTGPTNDMVADEQGRAYVGGYGFDAWVGEEFRPGNLVLVTPDGEARVVAEDLAGPNGTLILRNRALLVVAETRGRKLTAFDVAADGALSGRRVYADLGEHMPDGICLDEGGGIWVASFRGGVFLRVLEGGGHQPSCRRRRTHGGRLSAGRQGWPHALLSHLCEHLGGCLRRPLAGGCRSRESRCLRGGLTVSRANRA